MSDPAAAALHRNAAPLLRRWGRFVTERFPPATHVPMALLFTLGNVGLALRLGGGNGDRRATATAAAVSLLFFFRLRCFDELKDLAVDRVVDPQRPVAAGLLTPRDVRVMFVLLTLAELLLTASLGPAALATHAVAIAYSYLMYREFFIGPWLRPKLTTYAVTHTFVSVLLGYSVAAQVTGRALADFPAPLAWAGLANWALFNVYEFGRKTFAPGEERTGCDSYSTRFGPTGAVVLCLSQAVAAACLAAWAATAGAGAPAAAPAWVHAAAPVLMLLPGALYARRPTGVTARRYRTCVGAGLLLAYTLLGVAWAG